MSTTKTVKPRAAVIPLAKLFRLVEMCPGWKAWFKRRWPEGVPLTTATVKAAMLRRGTSAVCSQSYRLRGEKCPSYGGGPCWCTRLASPAGRRAFVAKIVEAKKAGAW